MIPSITIVCVRAGTKYPPEYVSILFDMVSRCMPEGMPYRQVCLTDQPETFENVTNLALPDGVHGWWAKLALFKPGMFDPGERVLYFDLDTVLVGMLDDILGYDGPFASLCDVYRPNGLQSSVLMWRAGEADFIWTLWERAGRPEVDGGDQAWIEQAVKMTSAGDLQFDRFQDLYPGQFVSYKVDCLSGPPADARVVFFHGDIKPHEFVSGWVADFWKIGGMAPVDLRLVCNVPSDDIKRNVEYALTLGLPELPYSCEPHDDEVCIVGGGPSVRSAISLLRAKRNCGSVIWALNGAGLWLAENGIEPDATWLLDARPENVGFIPPAPTATFFIASQCHPDVFRATEGCNVVLYHTDACRDYVPIDTTLVGGGSTVGLKAMAGAYMLGYKHICLFGMDSCYSGDDHHAFPQSMNDGETVLEPVIGGKKFRASAWMVQQAIEFQHMANEIVDNGVSVAAHGAGTMLHHFASAIEVGPSPATQRAEAILSRLPPGTVDGVEVGVFRGALSEKLFRLRSDLNMAMVDSWEGDGAAYVNGATDWNSKLSQRAQDEALFMARKVTEFADARRLVLRSRSLQAAQRIRKAVFDFVFIDADHTLAAVRADIEAWAPKVRPGGLLCGHDYDNPEFPEWGVKQAVDEFAERRGLVVDVGENFTWFIRMPAP